MIYYIINFIGYNFIGHFERFDDDQIAYVTLFLTGVFSFIVINNNYFYDALNWAYACMSIMKTRLPDMQVHMSTPSCFFINHIYDYAMLIYVHFCSDIELHYRDVEVKGICNSFVYDTLQRYVKITHAYSVLKLLAPGSYFEDSTIKHILVIVTLNIFF